MAQTGYTPILIYSSSTVSQAPSAGNLTNSTLGSELAINITDGKLFYKDNANAVQVIAWKTTPTTAGGTGLTSYTAGDLLYYASGTTLSKLAIGASTTILTSSGTAPQWSAASGITVGTSTNIAGGAQGSIPYQSAASTTAFLAKNTTATRYLANTGTNNNPAWAQIDLSDGVTGVLPVANGGTNASSAGITAFNNITGYTASGATGTTSTNLVFSTSPSITTPRVITSINDTNGNELFGVTATASAVNELTVANAATGNNPSLSATGSDTNIGITLTPKGTGNLVLTTGNLVVANGAGIDFSATSDGTGTASSELFDDYEEGTFTPTISGTTGDPTLTYATRFGYYTKVGRLVTVHIALQPSTVSVAGSGNLQFKGLPYTSANLTDMVGSGVSPYNGDLNWGANKTALVFSVAPNATIVGVWAQQNATAEAGVPVGNFNTSARYLYVTITYTAT